MSRRVRDEQLPSQLRERMEQLVQRGSDDDLGGLAQQWKALGNDCFAQNCFSTAIRCYTKALELVKRWADARGDSESGVLAPEEHIVLSNRSAAYVKSPLVAGPSLALKDAERVVALEPGWFKGYLRKGDALYAKKKLAEASEAYSTALQLNPSCAAARDGVQLCTSENSASAAEARSALPGEGPPRSPPAHHGGLPVGGGTNLVHSIQVSNKLFEEHRLSVEDTGAGGKGDEMDEVLGTLRSSVGSGTCNLTQTLNTRLSGYPACRATSSSSSSTSAFPGERGSASRGEGAMRLQHPTNRSNEVPRPRLSERSAPRDLTSPCMIEEWRREVVAGQRSTVLPPLVTADGGAVASSRVAEAYKASLLGNFRKRVAENPKLREQILHREETQLLQGGGVNYRRASDYRRKFANGTDGIGLAITTDAYKSHIGKEKYW